MVKVNFILSSGSGRNITVEACAGLSLMEVAVANDIDGIDAICGGAAACATCHVYLSQQWQDLIPDKAPEEEIMLAFVPNYTPMSRLACQIILTSEMNDIEVQVP